MKIFSAEKMSRIDEATIKAQKISSWDLMERASETFVNFLAHYILPGYSETISVLCGTGNNGGDGMAVARLLVEREYDVKVFILPISGEESDDFRKNRYLAGEYFSEMTEVRDIEDLQSIGEEDVLIDAVLGTGFNRPLHEKWEDILVYASNLGATRISIDIPSGLFADKYTESPAFRADMTFAFEAPKLSFFMPENQDIVGSWVHESIGLDERAMEDAKENNHFITHYMANLLLRNRKRHDHKGVFGHALMIAGSYGKTGAALLSSSAVLRAGAGLVTIHAPESAYQILQIGIPEAMVQVDAHKFTWSENQNLDKYTAIGVGPGIGTNQLSVNALIDLLVNADCPLVLDADALNIIAANPEMWQLIPQNSILTPHPGEAERLFGETNNSFERLELIREKAKEHQLTIILKGGNTVILTAEGQAVFNTLGNPGMATAGSGDVLTGILTGLLAQGYSTKNAAVLGVYIHSIAGDLAAFELEHESLLASDILSHLGRAFQSVRLGHMPLPPITFGGPLNLGGFGDFPDDDYDEEF